ncbi:hypothetical protein SAMN05443292_1586 [Halpernia frigidisoli]|uniref:Uncharacterized protein n=1 Tax=Halpernia frigidisoli TaxID=1125876 RepID=A0A1I3FRS6_9FLAO|nr:hypothetical protein SAMN05443292_1586 [Halpernia frigidisoli]
MPTAVLRDCEICEKFKFFFRKKFYLNRIISVPKFTPLTRASRSCLKKKLKKKIGHERDARASKCKYFTLFLTYFSSLRKKTINLLFSPDWTKILFCYCDYKNVQRIASYLAMTKKIVGKAGLNFKQKKTFSCF